MNEDTIICVNAKQLALIMAGLQHLPYFRPDTIPEVNALLNAIDGYRPLTAGDLADMARDEANADQCAAECEMTGDRVPQTDLF